MNDFKQRYEAYIDGYRTWPNQLQDGHSCDEMNGWFDARAGDWDPPTHQEAIVPSTDKKYENLAVLAAIGLIGGLVVLFWFFWRSISSL